MDRCWLSHCSDFLGPSDGFLWRVLCQSSRSDVFDTPSSPQRGAIRYLWRSEQIPGGFCGRHADCSWLSLCHEFAQKAFYLQKARRLLLWLLILCIAIFVYEVLPDSALPFIPSVYQDTTWVNEFAFALCYGYLVAVVLFNHPDRWLVRIFSWTPLRWLGLISFSLYIWHRPLIQILAANLGPSLRRLNPILTVGLFWLIAFTVSVIFCYFLFVLIEKPGMSLSEKLRQQMGRQAAQRQAMSDPIDPRPQSQVDTAIR